jgi:putative hydrolase of the HAD superfamily
VRSELRLDEPRRPGPAPPAGVRVVLLDGLGTLVSLEPPWPALVERLREAHCVELGLDDAERAFRAEMAYYRAHHHEGRDACSLARLRGNCARLLRAELPERVAERVSLADMTTAMLGSLRFAAYPDALAALPALRAHGLKLVAVSNWDVSLPAVLRTTGLAGLLDGTVTSAAIGAPKPAPAIFHAALALAGASPGQALHVGDSPAHDVQGALAAGIAPVLLRRGDARRGDANPVESPSGMPTISSLTELLA